MKEATKKEILWIKEIPDSMKTMKEDLVNRWDEYDFERKEILTTAYNKLGYTEFMKDHSYSDYKMINTCKREFHEENEKFADSLIIDLYNTVHAFTGDVIDWSGICYKDGSLNGIVYGKLGKVKVDSIYEGDYNIQCLRVLVEKI